MRLDDIRIVKEIHFEYEWNSKLCFAKIVYLRSLNESYSICNDNLRDIHLFQPGVYEDKYPYKSLVDVRYTIRAYWKYRKNGF